jgi:hypothetical protein
VYAFSCILPRLQSNGAFESTADLAGRGIQGGGSFATDLGDPFIVHGIAYTQNSAAMATQEWIFVYSKLAFLDHMHTGGYDILGDLDGDRDVVIDDVVLFHRCLNGPGAPPAPTCEVGVDADMDDDSDVDLDDFAVMQRNYMG